MTDAKLIDLAHGIADKFDIDPQLVSAIIEVESSWKPAATRFEPAFYYLVRLPHFATACKIPFKDEETAQKTSWGLMQIMGATARGLGFQGLLPTLVDPALGIEYGCRYLAALVRRYPKLEDHISAYNAGHPNWEHPGGNAKYVDKVLAAYI